MEEYKITKINQAINDSEYSLLLKVLDYYSIVPDNIVKIRSIYKVTVKNKNYCLKKFKHGDTKAIKGMKLVEYLKDNGFSDTAEFIPCTNGKECVRYKKNIYYLTSFIDGVECNFDNIEELKKASALLANFHIKSIGFKLKEIKIPNNSINWFDELKKETQELLNFKKIIENKKIKTNFDKLYYDSIDMFKNAFDKALLTLTHSAYPMFLKKVLDQRIICHDSFYYQNVLIDKNGKLYIIDLDSCLYDIHAYDIAKFIRRILYRKCYAWDFNICKIILEEYNKISKLSSDEYKIILAFLIVPQKYYKLGKKRYIKYKKWSEDKYIKKLNRLLNYVEKQNVFIEEYEKYYLVK